MKLLDRIGTVTVVTDPFFDNHLQIDDIPSAVESIKEILESATPQELSELLTPDKIMQSIQNWPIEQKVMLKCMLCGHLDVLFGSIGL